jgi:hypothetical protein
MVSIALACSGQRYTVHHYQMHAIRIVMACNIGCSERFTQYFDVCGQFSVFLCVLK